MSRAATFFANYGISSLDGRRLIAYDILTSSPRTTKHVAKDKDEDFEFDFPGLEADMKLTPMTLLSTAFTSASKELAVGQVGRTMSKLFSNGILPLDPSTQDRIKTKYPAPPLPLPQATQIDPEPESDDFLDIDVDVVTFSTEALLAIVNAKCIYTGAGAVLPSPQRDSRNHTL